MKRSKKKSVANPEFAEAVGHSTFLRLAWQSWKEELPKHGDRIYIILKLKGGYLPVTGVYLDERFPASMDGCIPATRWQTVKFDDFMSPAIVGGEHGETLFAWAKAVKVGKTLNDGCVLWHRKKTGLTFFNNLVKLRTTSEHVRRVTCKRKTVKQLNNKTKQMNRYAKLTAILAVSVIALSSFAQEKGATALLAKPTQVSALNTLNVKSTTATPVVATTTVPETNRVSAIVKEKSKVSYSVHSRGFIQNPKTGTVVYEIVSVVCGAMVA